MKFIIRIRDIDFIIYIKCSHALFSSIINFYFKNSFYRLNQNTRNNIYYEI